MPATAKIPILQIAAPPHRGRSNAERGPHARRRLLAGDRTCTARYGAGRGNPAASRRRTRPTEKGALAAPTSSRPPGQRPAPTIPCAPDGRSRRPGGPQHPPGGRPRPGHPAAARPASRGQRDLGRGRARPARRGDRRPARWARLHSAKVLPWSESGSAKPPRAARRPGPARPATSSGRIPLNRQAFDWLKQAGPKLRQTGRSCGGRVRHVARLDGAFGLGEPDRRRRPDRRRAGRAGQDRPARVAGGRLQGDRPRPRVHRRPDRGRGGRRRDALRPARRKSASPRRTAARSNWPAPCGGTGRSSSTSGRRT